MTDISNGMESLCEDIITQQKHRKDKIEQLRSQTKAIRDSARRFLDDSKKCRNQMQKELRNNLRQDREELIKNVSSLREDFRKKEKEIREDLSEAHNLWKKTIEILRAKKKEVN
jgi:hypothetical protein